MIFLWFIQMAYLPSEYITMYDISEAFRSEAYKIEMMAELEYQGFFLGGSNTTNMYRGSGNLTNKYNFIPTDAVYSFYLGYRNDNIEIGYNHLCQHPVAVYMTYMSGDISYEYAYDEIYVKIKGSQELF